MKIFKKDCLSKKLILALMLVILLGTTIMPSISYAGLTAAIGGALIQPICDLVCALGDGLMSVMQKSVFGIDGQISVDLTGKTPWYVWFGRLFGSSSCNYNSNYYYRRNWRSYCRN